MKTLSIGKRRGLQQCSSERGTISVLALDHRGNLRRALRPHDPEGVPPEEMVAFKQQVVGAVSPAASAALPYTELGGAQCTAAGALPGRVGLIVALEATGYGGDAGARESRLLSGWTVAKARCLGANAVKLLVYYHPRAAIAPRIEALVAQVAADCRAHDMALMLEPLAYALGTDHGKLSGAERREVVVQTAQTLTAIGGDVLKAEFPLDSKLEPDERTWQAACRELTEASQVPWILLSASVDFATYLRQVTVACEQGASGVAVGRAVWQEATDVEGEGRHRFLQAVALPRMQRVTALCEALARPWTEWYGPATIPPGFHESYDPR